MEGGEFKFTNDISVESLRQIQNKFSSERNWDQYHTPRNLLIALVGEVGEVSELFQWKNEVKDGVSDWSDCEKENLANELSDVMIYLIRLAEKCHVDLPKAVLKKIELNGQKYPVSKSFGSSKKYNELKL